MEPKPTCGLTAPRGNPGGRQPGRPSLWPELEAGWNPGFATWSDHNPDREFKGTKAQGKNLGSRARFRAGWWPVAWLFPGAHPHWGISGEQGGKTGATPLIGQVPHLEMWAEDRPASDLGKPRPQWAGSVGLHAAQWESMAQTVWLGF